jgi:flagellar protein FliS
MSYPNSPLAKYGAVNITTSSSGQFVVMLYDGIFRYLREAAAAMREGNRPRVGERIGRAHAILRHLLGAMVPEANPVLHERLTALYLFAMRHTTLANARRDPAMLEEVIRVLVPLRSAWNVAADQTVRDGGGLAKTG